MFIYNKKMLALKTVLFITTFSISNSYAMDDKDNYDIRKYFTSNPNTKPKQYNKNLESSNNFSGFQSNNELENNPYISNINYNIISNNTSRYSKQSITLEENNYGSSGFSYLQSKMDVNIMGNDPYNSDINKLDLKKILDEKLKKVEVSSKTLSDLDVYLTYLNDLLKTKIKEIQKDKPYEIIHEDNNKKLLKVDKNITDNISLFTSIKSIKTSIKYVQSSFKNEVQQEYLKKNPDIAPIIALESLPIINKQIDQLILQLKKRMFDCSALETFKL